MNRVFAKVLIAATLIMGQGGAAVSATVADARAAYVRHDYATAARLIRPLAERGDADAQAKLGDLYRRGLVSSKASRKRRDGIGRQRCKEMRERRTISA